MRPDIVSEILRAVLGWGRTEHSARSIHISMRGARAPPDLARSRAVDLCRCDRTRLLWGDRRCTAHHLAAARRRYPDRCRHRRRRVEPGADGQGGSRILDPLPSRSLRLHPAACRCRGIFAQPAFAGTCVAANDRRPQGKPAERGVVARLQRAADDRKSIHTPCSAQDRRDHAAG